MVVRTSSLPTHSPVIEQEALPYWEAASRENLVLPYCLGCNEHVWYPRGFCPSCGAQDVEWRNCTGRGVVYSFSVVRRAMGAWRDHVPYVVAMVALDEGPILATNVVGTDPLDIAVGDPVRAVFESADAEDAPAILRFERAVAPSDARTEEQ